MSHFRSGAKSSNFVNLPFGLSYSDVDANENSENPTIPLPIHDPINTKERTVAMRYINFLNSVRDGPFYTGSMTLPVGEISEINDGKAQAMVEQSGLNDGIERYSDKYLKKRRICVSMDVHPFSLDFFPSELHQVMGIKKRKQLALSKFNKIVDLFTGTSNEDEASVPILERLRPFAEDEVELEEGVEENSSDPEEDLDDQFDDDDDDDYNAEKYFDDGDDEANGDEEYGDEPAF